MHRRPYLRGVWHEPRPGTPSCRVCPTRCQSAGWRWPRALLPHQGRPGLRHRSPIWSLHELRPHFEKSKGFPAAGFGCIYKARKARCSRRATEDQGAAKRHGIPTLLLADALVVHARRREIKAILRFELTGFLAGAGHCQRPGRHRLWRENCSLLVVQSRPCVIKATQTQVPPSWLNATRYGLRQCCPRQRQSGDQPGSLSPAIGPCRRDSPAMARAEAMGMPLESYTQGTRTGQLGLATSVPTSSLNQGGSDVNCTWPIYRALDAPYATCHAASWIWHNVMLRHLRPCMPHAQAASGSRVLDAHESIAMTQAITGDPLGQPQASARRCISEITSLDSTQYHAGS